METAMRNTVNIKGFLVGPFNTLNSLGSIQSSAMELIMRGAFCICKRAEPELMSIMPMYTTHF